MLPHALALIVFVTMSWKQRDVIVITASCCTESEVRMEENVLGNVKNDWKAQLVSKV